VDAFSWGDDQRLRGATVRPRPKRYSSARRFCRALRDEAAITEEICLDEMDVVFLRNNPVVADGPDRLNPAIDFGRWLKRTGVLVVNDPDGLVRAGSKMYLAGFPESIRPRTLVSRDPETIKEFLRDLDRPAILKPLHGFGGQNVFYVRRRQVSNLNQMIHAVRREGYVIAQEFLPDVTRGDKRVLLLDGDPIRIGRRVAAYKRMRPKDDIRSNIHVGGTRRRCEFSEEDAQVCATLAPRLRGDGLYFVGVDLVGHKVLEINVFAPGGIHNINELYTVNAAEQVIDDLERRVAARAEGDSTDSEPADIMNK
jgi:glutathione synthase